MIKIDRNNLNRNEINGCFLTTFPLVDRTHKIGESPIMRNNEKTKMIHMKYNRDVYSRQVSRKKLYEYMRFS